MTSGQESISVFFPAYNDAATIGGLVEKTFELLRSTGRNFEIIVVNDGSTDGTAEVLQTLQERYGGTLRVVSHGQNRGYGAALRSGFAAATKDLVFYTDGDGQYDPRELSVLLERLEPSVGWVNGYKIKRSDPLYRVMIGKLYNAIIRTLFRLRISDVDCDFRLIRRQLLAHSDLHSNNGVICIELARQLQGQNCGLVEVPVHHYPRVAGRSQFFRWQSLLRTFRELASLFFKQSGVQHFRGAAVAFGIACLVVAATRLPLIPAQLYSFDSVNLALALEKFDPTLHQPQPPGYPFFVGEARLLYNVLGTPEQTFTALKLLISALSIALLYFLGQRMFSAWIGLAAAALLLMNPVMWFSGLTSPLRPHLALFSILAAYFCWRTLEGNRRYFYAASVALGLGGGFRPVLPLLLIPLWVWTGWRTGRARLLLRGAVLLAAITAIWVAVLVIASGGLWRMLTSFDNYVQVQTQQTSLLLGASLGEWRRMAGRAVLWTGLGTLPWLWTIPTAWRRRKQWLQSADPLHFLVLWFIPGFLFHLLIHIGDPDHALSTIPAVCLVGGVCIVAAEQNFRFRWILWLKERGFAIAVILFLSYCLLYLAQEPKQRWLVLWVALILSLLFLFPRFVAFSSGREELSGRGAIIALALLVNIFLFFLEFRVPQRGPVDHFRGWTSVEDALLIGTYETSYARVQWIDEMTQAAMSDITTLKADKTRPVVVVWYRDGVPSWRKVGFYNPGEPVYVLEEKGDPGISASVARVLTGTALHSRLLGEPPIRLPLPKRARVVWVMGGGRPQELSQVVPLRKAEALYYTDLPADSPSFRWGSFEFLPNGEQQTTVYKTPTAHGRSVH